MALAPVLTCKLWKRMRVFNWHSNIMPAQVSWIRLFLLRAASMTWKWAFIREKCSLLESGFIREGRVL
jgi:hypothetical protein